MQHDFDQAYYRKIYRLNPLQRMFGYKPGVLDVIATQRGRGRLLDIGCGIGCFARQGIPAA